MFDVSKVKSIDFKGESNAYLYQGELTIDEIKQFKEYIKEMEVTKMTKKFTEEQYQEIVDLQKSSYSWSILEQFTDFSFWRSLISADKKLTEFIHGNDLQDELAAIANPLTREWAHDKFVEKKKRYAWTSKQGTKSGRMHRRLYNGGFGNIKDVYIEDDKAISVNEKLTESDVRNSIYNPEMFDKEEV